MIGNIIIFIAGVFCGVTIISLLTIASDTDDEMNGINDEVNGINDEVNE